MQIFSAVDKENVLVHHQDMSEGQTGDGIGRVDQPDLTTAAKNGEVAVNEPQKIPITLQVKGHDGNIETVTDNFTLLRGVGALEGYLTTNASLLSEILKKGPLAFDEARRAGEDTDIKILFEQTEEMIKGENEPILKLMTLDANGVITYTPQEIVGIEPFQTDPITTLVEEGKDARDKIWKMTEMRYEHNYIYENLAQAHEAYQQLGFKFNENGVYALPSPHGLAEGIVRLRKVDTKSGIYYPDIEIYEQGMITNPDFVRAWANRRYPVGGADFEYYSHDVGQEHLLVLMAYGDPLMDLMANFASAMESLDSVELPFFSEREAKKYYLKGQLEGANKTEAAAIILDGLTNYLDIMELKTTDEVLAGEHHYMYEYPYRLQGMLDDVTRVLRQHGTFEELSLVKDMIEKGEVANADEITGKMIADRLITKTRERFGKGGPTNDPQDVMPQAA